MTDPGFMVSDQVRVRDTPEMVALGLVGQVGRIVAIRRRMGLFPDWELTLHLDDLSQRTVPIGAVELHLVTRAAE